MRERDGLDREVAVLQVPEQRVVFEYHEPHKTDAAKGRGAVALPACCTQPSPWPDRACDVSKPTPDLERRRNSRLIEALTDGVRRTSPHHASASGNGVFAGSFDWHSAVHAHWALLCIARVRKLPEFEAWLNRRLTDAALTAERQFLTTNKDFELPYGRGWLLMVLAELVRRGRRSAAITGLRDELQDAVLGWLEQSAFPAEDKKTGGLIAVHRSWLFAYLLVGLSEPTSNAVRERLRKLRKTKLEPARDRINAFVPGPSDFLDLRAVLAVVDRVDPIFAGTPAAIVMRTSPPLQDPPLAHAHSAGKAVVEMWPHAIASGRGDAQSCSRFHARMNELFSRPDHWADDFGRVSHWVPQFMWMGLWLEANRP